MTSTPAKGPETASATRPNPAVRRAAWLRLLTQWHWISSALCLVGMLFFAVTGVTLVNAEYFENTRPVMTRLSASLPAAVLADLQAAASEDEPTLPASLAAWVTQTWHISLAPKSVEWNEDEIFIDLKRPGVDVSLSIDPQSGKVSYEAGDRGWVAWLNELHKGRNAGPVWNGFLTVFALACVVFSVTGLLILQVHARSRWTVWPVTGLGLVIPLLLILLFIH